MGAPHISGTIRRSHNETMSGELHRTHNTDELQRLNFDRSKFSIRFLLAAHSGDVIIDSKVVCALIQLSIGGTRQGVKSEKNGDVRNLKRIEKRTYQVCQNRQGMVLARIR